MYLPLTALILVFAQLFDTFTADTGVGFREVILKSDQQVVGNQATSPIPGFETGYAIVSNARSGLTNNAEEDSETEATGNAAAGGTREQQETEQDRQEGDDDANGEDEANESAASSESESSESESEEPMVDVRIGGRRGSVNPVGVIPVVGPLPDARLTSIQAAKLIGAPNQAYPVKQYESLPIAFVAAAPYTDAASPKQANYDIRLVPPATRSGQNVSYAGVPFPSAPANGQAGQAIQSGRLADAPKAVLLGGSSTEDPTRYLQYAGTAGQILQRMKGVDGVDMGSTEDPSVTPYTGQANSGKVSHPVRFFKRSVESTRNLDNIETPNTERLRPKRKQRKGSMQKKKFFRP